MLEPSLFVLHAKVPSCCALDRPDQDELCQLRPRHAVDPADACSLAAVIFQAYLFCEQANRVSVLG